MLYRTEQFESGMCSNMSWVAAKINNIGMRQFLTDMIEYLRALDSPEPYLHLLLQDLEMTLSDHEDQEQTEHQ